MERTIPIDPLLEKGYNVRLLVDDFDGLIEKWSNWSEDFRANVDSSLTAIMAMVKKINSIFLGVESQMHPYLSSFMEATGKEEISQSTVLLLILL